MVDILRPSPDMVALISRERSEVPPRLPILRPRMVSLSRSIPPTTRVSERPVIDGSGRIVGRESETSFSIQIEIIMGDVDQLTSRIAQEQRLTDRNEIEKIRTRLTALYKIQERERQKERELEEAKRRIRVERSWERLLQKHPLMRMDITMLLDVVDREGGAVIKWGDDPNPDTYMADLRHGLGLSKRNGLQLWKLPYKYEAKVLDRKFSK